MMVKYLISILVALMLWPAAVLADRDGGDRFRGNLTGTWIGDDGGRYYLRQVGSTLYWYGEKKPSNPMWANVFHGKLDDGNVKGRWADVPKGRTASSGKLRLKIKNNGNRLVAIEKTGGFGGSQWTREGYRPPAARAPEKRARAQRSVSEDCVNFNPRRAAVTKIDGRYKIVDGNHWVFDFGGKKNEARRAMGIIRHYDINQSCYVGRPNPSLKYLLISGASPMGTVAKEDCVAFNPDRIQVKKVSGSWKIVQGNHWIFDFGSKADEARTAFDVIRNHRFSKSCFVGRPHPSFEYMRR
ncbi:MAG: hypothetical protein ABUK11_09025 [Mariprofundaceae bacterium]